MAKKLPVVQFEIDEENPLNGVKAISLVSEPAIESDYVFFNKEQEKPAFIELKSEKYKQVVAGLALIPDKKIYRVDKEGNEYYGVFSTETIEKIRNKFAKEKLTDRVNTEHDSEEFIEAYLLDNYIIESEHQLEHVKSLGIEEATVGSWFVSYKIEDAEVFKKVVSGELNGFSVEVFLQRLHKVENNFNKYESQMSKILEKFKALLLEVENSTKEDNKENEEVKTLASAKDENGVTYEYGEVGEAVNVVDAEGNKTAAADGEYKLDNGKIVTVASGVATEIKDAEEAPAEEEANKQSKEEKLASSIYASYQLKDGKQASVNVSNINEVYIYDGENSELASTGEYELKDGGVLMVQDGAFAGVKDAAETKDFDEKKELVQAKAELSKTQKELASVKEELAAISTEIENFKKKPLAKPVTKTKKVEEEEVDESKLSNLDRLRREYNIK